MPIVVDPSFVPPPPPTVATSTDGVLTATSDPANAGVLLKADFTFLTTQLPTKVLFMRDGVPVRSGDKAGAPGGIAVAYDHEAPLGQPSSWTAQPFFYDGTWDAPSAPATLTVPTPTGNTAKAWLKSVDQPDLSQRVRIQSFVEGGRDPRTQLAPVLSGTFPIGSRDVLSSLTATLTVRTDTKADYDALVALLGSQTLLLQTHDSMGIPSELYAVVADKIAASRLGGHSLGWALRWWDLPLVQVARPATLDAPLVIPGKSWDDVAATYATWDDLAAQVPTWVALLGA